MRFSEIAVMFDKLESTGSRLEMTDILADFFRNIPPEDLRNIIYLSQGKLHPDFYQQELGMADNSFSRQYPSPQEFLILKLKNFGSKVATQERLPRCSLLEKNRPPLTLNH
jgi:hypothetical protein